MSLQTKLEEQRDRNASLRATLQALKAPAPEETTVVSATQAKAQQAFKVIALQERELAAKQKLETQELQLKQLQSKMKESTEDLKAVTTEITKERQSGMSVWEQTGISTVSYRDPFHTGLSKRTPTGARAHSRVRCALHRLTPPRAQRGDAFPAVQRAGARAARMSNGASSCAAAIRRRLLYIMSSSRRRAWWVRFCEVDASLRRRASTSRPIAVHQGAEELVRTQELCRVCVAQRVTGGWNDTRSRALGYMFRSQCETICSGRPRPL